MPELPKYQATIMDSFLGELIFNAEMTWYSGCIEIDDENVEFNIGVRFDIENHQHNGSFQSKLDAHLDFVANLFHDKFHQKAYQQMLKSLYPIKNAEWLETGEASVELQDFSESIELKGILIYEEGSAELSYTDGGIFWGHDIIVYTDPKGQFEEAHLAE